MELSEQQREELERVILARLEAKSSHEYQWPRWAAADEAAEAVAPVVARMIAEAWPCDNYRAPLTCLTAPSSETSRCDWCKSAYARGAAEQAARVEAALPTKLDKIRADALREWIGEWPADPNDGTFLGDVARDGLERADRIEAGDAQ